MSATRSRGGVLAATGAAVLIVLACSDGRANAAGIATYQWVVDSSIGTEPTSATFQVDLAAVQTGKITQLDITNIQFAFPGIGPLTFTTGSSIGLDNAAYVDPTTGLPVFNNNNQGLAVIAYQGSLFSDTFLSITFDQVGGDQFNAIDGGPGSLGRGQGHWTATLTPAIVPEPGGLLMLALGIVGSSLAARRYSGR